MAASMANAGAGAHTATAKAAQRKLCKLSKRRLPARSDRPELIAVSPRTRQIFPTAATPAQWQPGNRLKPKIVPKLRLSTAPDPLWIRPARADARVVQADGAVFGRRGKSRR